MTPHRGSVGSLNDRTAVRKQCAIVRYLQSPETWAPYADELPGGLALPLVARRSNVVFVARAE